MTTEGGDLRTEDLVLASVLSMHGLTPTLEKKENRRAIFVFVLDEADDPEFIQELVDEVLALRCKVEPKRFAREMKHVREMLYDFLGTRQGRRLQHR